MCFRHLEKIIQQAFPRISQNACGGGRHDSINRAVPSAIIGGGGGVYSYIRVLPDGFLLKAIVFPVCEHEYMNIHPPPHYRV
jgi:hypothetical protein